jgi:transaldolase
MDATDVARLEPILRPFVGARGERAGRQRVSTPLLSALLAAGTEHVYADTADVEELAALVRTGDGSLRREVDGNTANQPLVQKVVARTLDAGDPRTWADALADRSRHDRRDRSALLYAILCARIGNDLNAAFGTGRRWEASLQLHMDLCADPEAARAVGHLLRRLVPDAIVKVPFTPDAPHCFLVARDLEQAGVPVNFTSTFSARQAVAAALLADVARTNVFMGRLNQGLEAERLGEHVDLEAQRALRRLRREDGVRTRLIVASIREWQTFVRVAGCDVFTAPCEAIRDFLEQEEIEPSEIDSRLETSYESELGVSAAVRERLGAERIARTYRVEPELVEFLRGLRGSRDYAALDGEGLYRRFDEAGFSDLFHAPTPAERQELERGKLPQLDGGLIERVPLDTHYSLLANADFARAQREIDEEIAKRLDGRR